MVGVVVGSVVRGEKGRRVTSRVSEESHVDRQNKKRKVFILLINLGSYYQKLGSRLDGQKGRLLEQKALCNNTRSGKVRINYSSSK